jgi:hypothetical protein
MGNRNWDCLCLYFEKTRMDIMNEQTMYAFTIYVVILGIVLGFTLSMIQNFKKFVKERQDSLEYANELYDELDRIVKNSNALYIDTVALLEYNNKMNQKIAILKSVNPDNPKVLELYEFMVEETAKFRKSQTVFQ